MSWRWNQKNLTCSSKRFNSELAHSPGFCVAIVHLIVALAFYLHLLLALDRAYICGPRKTQSMESHLPKYHQAENHFN